MHDPPADRNVVHGTPANGETMNTRAAGGSVMAEFPRSLIEFQTQ